MPPKKQTFEVVPKIIHLSQSLKKKAPLEMGGITPILPSTRKNPFEKNKNLPPACPLSLKLHLQLVIFLIYLNNPLFIPIGTP